MLDKVSFQVESKPDMHRMVGSKIQVTRKELKFENKLMKNLETECCASMRKLDKPHTIKKKYLLNWLKDYLQN